MPATTGIDAADVPGPCRLWPKDSAFIREVLDRIGDKWSVLVIGTLQEGPLRYSELKNIVPGVSQRMLTLTLQQLHRDGLITRTAHAEVPPRVEYALTELGETLLEAVLSLSSWAAKNHEAVSANRTAFDEALQTA
ncbi:helix-turn-helix domain-containing protein [Arthrobacter sp. NPDC093128]|uniref:winged helix-turn-helix transcriptional regulator n=1 Tax=Arthrobacter sp. NPDC093128 TaxID=3154979 RepID=UPI003438A8C4